MPFTLAHPALLLPLEKYRRTFSFTALVAGSMAPDVEFFLHLKVINVNMGHHFKGIFLFDLPVALSLSLIFHLCIKDVLIAHLPALLQKRLQPYQGRSVLAFARKRMAVLIYSALIGIASHLFWDAFTHEDGLFVQLLPPLGATWMLGQFELKVYTLLQLISSVVGLLLIFCYLLNKPLQPVGQNMESQKGVFWLSMMAIFLAAMAVRIAAMPDYLSALDLVMAAMGLGFISLLMNCVLFAGSPGNLGRRDGCFNKFI